MNLSSDSALVLARMYPPFPRSAKLLYPFTSEGRLNAGITVQTETLEAVAAGAGQVVQVYPALPDWQTGSLTLDRCTVQHVCLDHGNGVRSVVGGLASVSVTPGQTVQRGDPLGTLQENVLFFSLLVGKSPYNPLKINRHWLPQNDNVVAGQGGKLRFAPDRLVRDLSQGIAALLSGGLHYFKRDPVTPTLVNIAFNGSMTGPAVVGYEGSDYWNTYTPEDYTATLSGACYGGYYSPSTTAVLPLLDYAAQPCSIVLERVAPLFSTAGSGVSWTALLQAWIGGYVGPVPYENTFRLHNLAAGTYQLYLYANQGVVPVASTFYAAVNGDTPTAQFNDPVVTAAYVEDRNYVRYTLVVPAGGYITFKAVGYLSGMQLHRS